MRILWIDDEVRSDDASVCLLALEGFRVDCADSGAAGLSMSLAGAYGGIILDLRLQDTSGLAVLGSLVAAGIHTPVLLLTGFGDQETATAAMKLGAADFKSKPLFADDLIAAVRTLTTLTPSPGLERLGSSVPPPAGVPNRKDGQTEGPRNLAEAAQALTRPHPPAAEFLALAHALHRAITTRPHLANGRTVTAASQLDPYRRADLEMVQRIVAEIERDLASGLLSSTARIGDAVGMIPPDVGQLLCEHLGAGFLKCRLALRLRPAVREVAWTDEQIAQIAFQAGYHHPGQFDRDFREVFGLTPSAFRWLCKSDGRWRQSENR